MFSLLVGSGERPIQTPVYFANHDFFPVLGVRVALGRNFTPDDDRRGAPLVALLSDRYWRRSFDAAPGVLGRSLTVAGKRTTIIGVVARGLFDGVRTFQLPGGIAIELLDLSPGVRVPMAAAACAAAATLVISIVAARLGFGVSIADALRGRSAATPAATGRRTRSVLVAGQVAVAMVLLAGAGLFARSIVAALSVNPGFETTRIVTGSLSLGPYGYAPDRAAAFFATVRDRLAANPAIRSVSLTSPQGGMSTSGCLVIDGVPRQFPSTVGFTAIDQAHFATIGVRVTEGRDFSDQDREATRRVAIVSESFGRMLANGGSALGRRVTMPWGRPGQPPDVLEIVGVVPDLITNVNTLQPLVIHWPMAQASTSTYGALVLRAARDANGARREAMSAIRQLNPSVSPSPMLTIEERLAEQMAAQRFGALVMGALGVIAILLTLLGAYVLAESMAFARRREMGIRASLGAPRWRLGGLVLAQTGRLVGVGLIAGLGLAWAGANMIRPFLFGIEPLDRATLAGVAALILVSAVAITARPAVRAARVDLTRVLREE